MPRLGKGSGSEDHVRREICPSLGRCSELRGWQVLVDGGLQRVLDDASQAFPSAVSQEDAAVVVADYAVTLLLVE
eukprot:8496461-Pyramimonas_sp.AAC.1